jgi:hypothetical protein
MTVADSQGTPTSGPASSANLLQIIARSSDVSWLTTCLNHNVKMGNTIVVQAAQQRSVGHRRCRCGWNPHVRNPTGSSHLACAHRARQ